MSSERWSSCCCWHSHTNAGDDDDEKMWQLIKAMTPVKIACDLAAERHCTLGGTNMCATTAQQVTKMAAYGSSWGSRVGVQLRSSELILVNFEIARDIEIEKHVRCTLRRAWMQAVNWRTRNSTLQWWTAEQTLRKENGPHCALSSLTNGKKAPGHKCGQQEQWKH